MRTIREDILEEARQIVVGERTATYGQPEDSFRTVADYWSTYLGREITSCDVAVMMILLKVARQSNGTGSVDSFVDIAGYAACGGEAYTEVLCNESNEDPESEIS